MAILIISDSTDQTTDDVIDWIHLKKKKFYRVDFEYLVKYLNIQFSLSANFSNVILTDKQSTGTTLNIDAIWFRKDDHIEVPTFEHFDFYENEVFKNRIEKETLTIKRVIFDAASFTGVIGLSGYNRSYKLSKIEFLKLARDVGLKVPDTIITNSKKCLIDFKQKVKRVISKATNENLFLISKKYGAHFQYTHEVSDENIQQFPNKFFPSLFQELIEKDYEIRTFYIDGKIFSICIFSQVDEATSIDFRASNYSNMNRVVPFLLPQEITSLIRELMKKAEINIGCIDLLRSLTGDYYFLEVNPNGEFGMVSKPGNYYLEKEVANFLCNEK